MKVIRPVGGRIIVFQTEAQRETDSGIHLIQQAVERPNTGYVVMGTDSYTSEEACNKEIPSGSLVLFNKYAGVRHKMDGKEFLILRPEDVLGIIEDVSGLIGDDEVEGDSAA